MCIFLAKARIKQHFYHFCTYPCKRILISPDMTIIARCDNCVKTGCVARDCLCVYAYAQMALAIMPTSHARSHYQKSLLRDNDRAVFRAKLVTIYVDWIALLRRLLMYHHIVYAWIMFMQILLAYFICTWSISVEATLVMIIMQYA